MVEQALADRIEGIGDALRAQNRMLAMMLGNQKLELDMLSQILKKVTPTDADDSPLEKLLAELVAASREQLSKLDIIIERVYPLE